MNKYQKGNTNVVVSLVVVVCAIGLIVYGLSRGTKYPNQDNNQSNKEGIYNTQKTMDNIDNSTRISKAGDVLIVNYTGRLVDGTVFDSNVDPRFNHVEPFKFILGAGYVIKGWDDGLVGMKIGEQKTLTIPPELGYGDRAVGSIPANSTLIFDIEVLSIE